MSPIDLKMRNIALVPGTTVRRTSGSVRVSELDLAYRIPTLDVDIRSTDAIDPEEEDYVVLKDPSGSTIFGGKVKQLRRVVRPVNRIFFQVTAQGWEGILEGLPITTPRTFDAGTPDSYMLKVLLEDNYGPIKTGIVPVLYSFRADMPGMTFATGGDGKGTLGRALRRIFGEAGCDTFWIDGDKIPHYNDVGSEAPYVLVKTAGDDVETNEVQGELTHFVDVAQKPTRIRVIGAGAAEYTATDWMEWDKIQHKLSTEPGTPTPRIWQLPDELDTDLTTNDQCRARAFQRLADEAIGRRIGVSTRAHGFRPGQLVAVMEPLLPPIPYDGDYHAIHHTESAVYHHRYDDLHLTMGWLQIQRVNLTILDHNRIRYELELGDPQPSFEDTMVQSVELVEA